MTFHHMMYERYIMNTVSTAGFWIWETIDIAATDWKNSGETGSFSSFLCKNAKKYSDIPDFAVFVHETLRNPYFIMQYSKNDKELEQLCAEGGLDFATMKRLLQNYKAHSEKELCL